MRRPPLLGQTCSLLVGGTATECDVEVVMDLLLLGVGVRDGGAPWGAHGVVGPEELRLHVAGGKVLHSGGRGCLVPAGYPLGPSRPRPLPGLRSVLYFRCYVH